MEERGNTKHGPVQDDELAQETEGMVRGAPERPHVEEWRETEPVEDAIPPPHRVPEARETSLHRDIELRSELARVLSRDLFPADRDTLRDRLDGTNVPPELVDRVARLPAGRSFDSPHGVFEALGIASPETRSREEEQ
jgi:hypothetical protein